MIDERIATDLLEMAELVEAKAARWPEMDEEEAPRAAVSEVTAILRDAAATTMPRPDQTSLSA